MNNAGQSTFAPSSPFTPRKETASAARSDDAKANYLMAIHSKNNAQASIEPSAANSSDSRRLLCPAVGEFEWASEFCGAFIADG